MQFECVEYASAASVSLEYIKPIGQEGKNSTVWQARDPQADRIVAVKKVEKSRIRDIGRYHREAFLLNSLRHPNVAQLVFGGEDDDHVVIVMPFYENGSLSRAIAKRQPTVREIVETGLGVLTGLHHIHVHKVVHCDLKPNNVLIGPTRRPVITDFGLAEQLDDHGLATLELVYAAHLAPEQFAAYVGTVQTDIYQAGLTLYRLCNSESFFKGQFGALTVPSPFGISPLRDAVQKGLFPNRSSFLPHIPQKLITVIKRALAPNPDKRYQSVVDMMNDLASVDQYLDWRPKLDTPGSYSWSFDSIEILAEHVAGSHWSVTTTKATKAGTKRVKDGCALNVGGTFEASWPLIKNTIKALSPST